MDTYDIIMLKTERPTVTALIKVRHVTALSGALPGFPSSESAVSVKLSFSP